jgi:prepilin-type N-terminal cleavage/methylation domain-containing protein
MTVRRSGGFTLVELLIVIFIISTMIAIAILSFRPGVSAGKSWADELKERIIYAQNAALLAQVQFGMQVSKESLRFLAYTEDGWQASSEKSLTELEFPENDGIFMYLDDSLVVLPETHKKKLPQVLISSSIDSTAFELHLQDDLNTYVTKVNGLGEFEYEVRK